MQCQASLVSKCTDLHPHPQNLKILSFGVKPSFLVMPWSCSLKSSLEFDPGRTPSTTPVSTPILRSSSALPEGSQRAGKYYDSLSDLGSAQRTSGVGVGRSLPHQSTFSNVISGISKRCSYVSSGVVRFIQTALRCAGKFSFLTDSMI